MVKTTLARTSNSHDGSERHRRAGREGPDRVAVDNRGNRSTGGLVRHAGRVGPDGEVRSCRTRSDSRHAEADEVQVDPLRPAVEDVKQRLQAEVSLYRG